MALFAKVRKSDSVILAVYNIGVGGSIPLEIGTSIVVIANSDADLYSSKSHTDYVASGGQIVGKPGTKSKKIGVN